jgi:hypothetical protein
VYDRGRVTGSPRGVGSSRTISWVHVDATANGRIYAELGTQQGERIVRLKARAEDQLTDLLFDASVKSHALRWTAGGLAVGGVT